MLVELCLWLRIKDLIVNPYTYFIAGIKYEDFDYINSEMKHVWRLN